jgi:hypothetical protein
VAPRRAPSGDARAFGGALRAAGHGSRDAGHTSNDPCGASDDSRVHESRAAMATAGDTPDDTSPDGTSIDDDASAATAASAIAVALGLVRPATAPVVHAPVNASKAAAAPVDGVATSPRSATALAEADEPAAPPPAPMTPLERAVHELLEQIDEHEDVPAAVPEAPAPPATLAAAPAEIRDAPREQPAVPAARIDAPSPITPQSHVHLVLDDGPERVVVTVAVRGSDVHVALRANDDLVSANLARNAAVLDHAMRARGLVLAELATDTPPERQRRDREPPPPPRRNTEPFELEETP